MKKILIGIIISASVLTLTSCSKNQDVKDGAVFIDDISMTKYCDGTTLVYSKAYAMAVIPNSLECK